MYRVNSENIKGLITGDIIQSDTFGYLLIVTNNDTTAEELSYRSTTSSNRQTLAYEEFHTNEENTESFVYRGSIV